MTKFNIIKLIDCYWKFDEWQHPSSNWHDKQDLMIELESKLLDLQREAFEAGREALNGKYSGIIDDPNGNYIDGFIPKYETFEDFLKINE